MRASDSAKRRGVASRSSVRSPSASRFSVAACAAPAAAAPVAAAMYARSFRSSDRDFASPPAISSSSSSSPSSALDWRRLPWDRPQLGSYCATPQARGSRDAHRSVRSQLANVPSMMKPCIWPVASSRATRPQGSSAARATRSYM